MNIEKLRYIVEVARSNSIKLASENLHVTQSAISQTISSVEKELGVKIFTRSRGQYSLLTEEGKGIVKKAYEILIKFDELKEFAQSQNTEMKGELILSTTAGYMNYLIHPLAEFKDHYPNIKVEIIETRNTDIVEGVQQHRFDVGLVANYGDLLKNKNDIEFNLLTDGRAKAYVNKDSLLNYTGKISLEELQDHFLIAYRGDYTRQFIQKYSDIFGSLNVLFKSNNTETILNAVSSGLGYTISHDFLMNKNPYMKNGQIVPLDIIDHTHSFPLNVSFGWIRSKNKHIPSFTKKFLKIIEMDV